MLIDYDTAECHCGLTEIVGLDIDGRVKKRGWTLQDWTLTDNFAGVDIAGLDNEGLDIDRRIWAIDCNQLKITIERFY